MTTGPGTIVRRLRPLLWLAVVLAIALGGAPARGQSAPDIAVVVHPDVPVDNLTFAELRRVLLGDREFWTSGLRVRCSFVRRSRASATWRSRACAR